jgi:hypothetical protein
MTPGTRRLRQQAAEEPPPVMQDARCKMQKDDWNISDVLHFELRMLNYC